MSWVTIRAAIKTKLDTLVMSGTLGIVYNGELQQQNVDIPAWPAAELVRIDESSDYLTNREDLDTYNFAINLLLQFPDDRTNTVEITMDAVLDTVKQTFLSDATLGGVLDARIEPIAMVGSVITWFGKQVRKDQIILKCRKIKSM